MSKIPFPTRRNDFKKNLTSIFLGVLVAASQDAFSQTVWTLQNSGMKSNLTAVTWTGDQLVAVGHNGVILTSPDGETWKTQNSGITTELQSITWSGTLLVAVGGVIITSPDGITWTKRDIGKGEYFFSVIRGGGRFFAGGSEIHSSLDGIAWNKVSSFPVNMPPIWDMVWTGDFYIAVADFSTFAVSPDGMQWTTHHDFQAPTIGSVTWNGREIIGSDGEIVYTSADGIAWKKLTTTGRPYPWGSTIHWFNNLLIYTNDNSIHTSIDGKAWTKQNSGTEQSIRDVAFTGKRFVAVGDSGTILTSPAEAVTVRNPSPAEKDMLLFLKYTGKKLVVSMSSRFPGKAAVRIRIYSLTGKRVYETVAVNSNKTVELAIGILPAGNYMAVVSGAGDASMEFFPVIR